MLPKSGTEKLRAQVLENVFHENQRVFYPQKVRARKQRRRFFASSLRIFVTIFPVLLGWIVLTSPDMRPHLQKTFGDWQEQLQVWNLLPADPPPDKNQLMLTNNSIFPWWSSADLVLSTPLQPPLAHTLTPTSAPMGDKTGMAWGELLLSQHELLLSNEKFTLKGVYGLGVKTVVIDPGHGGKDPGTSGKMGLQEKTVVLDIALQLKQLLEENHGIKVFITRDDDTFLSLDERIAFANEQKADLFISLHVNYLPSKPVNIIETYYYGITDDEEALELARDENHHSEIGHGQFKEMVEKIGNTLKLQESERLAESIQQSLYHNISQGSQGVLDMGIKQAPFLVIMGTDMPAVLAEVTCLSNEQEETKLGTADYRRDIAGYLETGIVNYLNSGGEFYAAVE
jgi:N-acetylmuramoyl-L-alanine amidase